MCGPLFFLLIIIPAVELSLLIRIGAKLGVLSTVWLVLLTAAVGLFFVRRQGLSVLKQLQTPGPDLTVRMLEGPLLALAAVCLMIPGFVTDALGGLLLIPPLRRLAARIALTRLMARAQENSAHQTIHFTFHQPGQSTFRGEEFAATEDDEETIVTITEMETETPRSLPKPDDDVDDEFKRSNDQE